MLSNLARNYSPSPPQASYPDLYSSDIDGEFELDDTDSQCSFSLERASANKI
jgi:hypothetical protein